MQVENIWGLGERVSSSMVSSDIYSDPESPSETALSLPSTALKQEGMRRWKKS
jgi:hypothetical protein